VRLNDKYLLRPPVSRLTLQITDRCNLGCEYCFAKKGNEEGRFVSEEDFGYFLFFSLRNRMHGVRFTGGEPMLHPHVYRFIHLAVQAGLPVHIFSNFTIPECVKQIDVPAVALSFLVNINDRDMYNSRAWKAIEDNLETAATRRYPVVLAYTACSPTFDIHHIRELAVRNGIQKIRVSPAMPMIGTGNRWLQLEHIPVFAETVYKLHRELSVLGKYLVFDCPIPLCFLPPERLPFFFSYMKLSGNCLFGASVDVQLEVGHCYITNALLERRSLRSFTHAFEIMDYLSDCLKTLNERCPLFPECAVCDHLKEGRCTAGCYGIRHYKASCLEYRHSPTD